MITVCELCAKISIEEAIKEAQRLEQEALLQMKKVEVAEAFAEEILSPIIENLHEMPNRLFLGYRSEATDVAFYTSLSDWKTGLTNYGNPKQERRFINPVLSPNGRSFSLLDYSLVNAYLRDYGFQISCSSMFVEFTKYSTSTRNAGQYVDHLYLSTLCENI